MTRRRPPTPHELTALNADLATLRAALDNPDTGARLRTIYDATQDCYPSRHGAPPTRSSTGGSPTELQATTRREPVATHAERVLDAFHQLRALTATALAGLDAWDPDRPVECCPDCGHPIDRTRSRVCLHVDPDTGLRCGAKPDSITCGDCGGDVPRGKIRRGLCDACRKYRDRHGRARVATLDRLGLDPAVIATGAYVDAG